ncbi:hypothetical protein [Bacillus sp. JCM 19034]|uniref:hypothetical protein n=1 Tax=Bacillus sp. JCM 19034 TaxID=1481928 RepID=UPI0007824B73|nr:hypothetical protein [Bacillus sp. JCM 19034]
MESVWSILMRFPLGIAIYGGVRVIFGVIEDKEIDWGTLTKETLVFATLYTLFYLLIHFSKDKKEED